MDDIKSTITDIAGSVAKKSSQFLRSTKLTMALTSEEQKLKNLYFDIGKKVHEIYRYGGSLGEAFDEVYAQIREIDGRIKALKREIAENKGVTSCGSCGASVEREADFCPKCGSPNGHPAPRQREPRQETPEREAPRQQEPRPAASNAPPPSERPVVSNEKSCPVCGKMNAASERFCLLCGRVI